MLKLLAVIACGVVPSLARADAPLRQSPADCFCAPPARDLSFGRFEAGGVFVVELPLTPGPGEVMRKVGDRIDTGLGSTPSGPVLLADYAFGGGQAPDPDPEDAEWCALPINDIGDRPETFRITHMCRYATSSGYGQECTVSLPLSDVASLYPRYARDNACDAHIRALGVDDPNASDGCATGPGSLAALATLLAPFLAWRRARTFSACRSRR